MRRKNKMISTQITRPIELDSVLLEYSIPFELVTVALDDSKPVGNRVREMSRNIECMLDASSSIINGDSQPYQLKDVIFSNDRTVIYYAQGMESGQEFVLKKFTARDQFERERSIQEKLKGSGSHDNLLLAIEFIDAEELFTVSPYAGGGDLGLLTHKKTLTPYQAEDLVVGLCDALDFMHKCNLVHGDIKGRNIVFDIDGAFSYSNPKIIDYEFSWHPDFADQEKTNLVAGTPLYMAPELIMESKPSPQSDIYALGILMFELFTGEFPFNAKNKQILALWRAHLNKPVPDLSEKSSEVNANVARVIYRALEKNPQDRYHSVLDLKQDYIAAVRA